MPAKHAPVLTPRARQCNILLLLLSGIVTVNAEEGLTEAAAVHRHAVAGQTFVVMEARCQRFLAAAGLGADWALHPVAAAPADFLKFVGPASSGGGASRELYRAVYGDNNMQLPRTSVWEILARQIIHPFYIFQYFSVAVW